MRAGGYVLGGEQSGHVVLLEHATTGDGMLTALQRPGPDGADRPPARRARRRHGPRLPQVLVNVAGVERSRGDSAPRLSAAVAHGRGASSGSDGRVLLRPSGTEPLVRVMVEAPTEALARDIADRLAAVVRTELALD